MSGVLPVPPTRTLPTLTVRTAAARLPQHADAVRGVPHADAGRVETGGRREQHAADASRANRCASHSRSTGARRVAHAGLAFAALGGEGAADDRERDRERSLLRARHDGGARPGPAAAAASIAKRAQSRAIMSALSRAWIAPPRREQSARRPSATFATCGPDDHRGPDRGGLEHVVTADAATSVPPTKASAGAAIETGELAERVEQEHVGVARPARRRPGRERPSAGRA